MILMVVQVAVLVSSGYYNSGLQEVCDGGCKKCVMVVAGGVAGSV